MIKFENVVLFCDDAADMGDESCKDTLTFTADIGAVSFRTCRESKDYYEVITVNVSRSDARQFAEALLAAAA